MIVKYHNYFEFATKQLLINKMIELHTGITEPELKITDNTSGFRRDEASRRNPAWTES